MVEDPSAWYAADFIGKEDDYVFKLKIAHISELEAAMASIKKRGLEIQVTALTIHASQSGSCASSSFRNHLLCLGKGLPLEIPAAKRCSRGSLSYMQPLKR